MKVYFLFTSALDIEEYYVGVVPGAPFKLISQRPKPHLDPAVVAEWVDYRIFTLILGLHMFGRCYCAVDLFSMVVWLDYRELKG